MGKLIDCDHAYNAIQITSDKFGVASLVVWRAFCNMLGRIPSVDAIRIPENATNGDMIKAMFPDAQINYHEKTDLVDGHVTVFLKGCDTCQDYSLDWWNAPYRQDGAACTVFYANDKPVIRMPLPAQCQDEECEKEESNDKSN
jgi:hypothetical protein